MTSDKLAEIEARANATTPGPWECDRHGSVRGGPVRQFARGEGREQIVMTVGQVWMREAEQIENARFIAHARADIPTLIAAVRERDAEIARLRNDTEFRQMRDNCAAACAEVIRLRDRLTEAEDLLRGVISPVKETEDISVLAIRPFLRGTK